MIQPDAVADDPRRVSMVLVQRRRHGAQQTGLLRRTTVTRSMLNWLMRITQAMKHKLYIVTGAPASGKTLAAQEFSKLNSEFIAFDIDWLAEPASALAGKSIYSERSTWEPYGKIWWEVLHSIYRNNKTPVFFAPIDQRDIDKNGAPEWCGGVEWLLLDCDDDTRRQRIVARHRDPDREMDIFEDAAYMRSMVHKRIDTAKLSPREVAEAILEWLRSSGVKNGQDGGRGLYV